jgi:DNA-3-methyladenine glycosylase II
MGAAVTAPVLAVSETVLVGGREVSSPGYWSEACRHLSRRDRVMKKLVASYPGAVLQSRGDAFTTLARSVVGQQISVKAAQSVWTRFHALADTMTPQCVLGLKVDDMRQAGLSARKVEYLQDLSKRFAESSLSLALWPQMTDEEIIKELVSIRGVGRWTAEMFLIFHLMRPNVLPLDDVGLTNGISQAYYSGEPVSRSEVRELAASWSPYATVATWYIWRSLDPVPVNY